MTGTSIDKTLTGEGQEEYQLFHTRQVGRGREIGKFIAELIGFPLVALLFWLLYRKTGHGMAFLLFLAAWLGLLVEGGGTLYKLLQPGPRRWVYGVNSKCVFKKLLRGKQDPLWSAERASAADLDPAGCDEYWDLSEFSVSSGRKAITLKGNKPVSVSGEEYPPVQVSIQKTEFGDDRTFERFRQALSDTV